MSGCSLTISEAAKNWPEGIISVKLTMNPYLLTLAEEASEKTGIKLWEFINVALWEKLGAPDQESMLNYAAGLDVCDDDPKWKKRLQLTARHEIEVNELKRSMGAAQNKSKISSDNGDR